MSDPMSLEELHTCGKMQGNNRHKRHSCRHVAVDRLIGREATITDATANATTVALSYTFRANFQEHSAGRARLPIVPPSCVITTSKPSVIKLLCSLSC